MVRDNTFNSLEPIVKTSILNQSPTPKPRDHPNVTKINLDIDSKANPSVVH